MGTNLIDIWRQYIKHFFEEYVYGSMYSDIEAAMNAEAKHLVALGLSTYIEVLGGFVTGLLGEDGFGRQRFEAFLFGYMGKSYEDEKKQRNLDIYDAVRCGLVHQYFMKRFPYATGAGIVKYAYPGCRCGVNLDKVVRGGVEENEVVIVLEKFLSDFKSGVDKYYNQLLIDHDEKAIENFAKALGNA